MKNTKTTQHDDDVRKQIKAEVTNQLHRYYGRRNLPSGLIDNCIITAEQFINKGHAVYEACCLAVETWTH